MINKALSRFATHDNSAYPQLWRGCVGAWCPSVGPSGSRLHDYSRRMAWGELTNMDAATDWVVSGGAYALDFDGTNDRVQLPTLDLLRQPFSVSAWALRRSSGNNHTILDGATDAVNSYGAHLRFTTTNVLRFYFNNAVSALADTTTQPANNVWHHAVGVFDGVTTAIWLNGKRESAATGDSYGTATAGYRIGCLTDVYGANAGVMNGLIDDVRLYNRALTAFEIRLLSSRRGIAFTPRSWRLAVPEQAAAGATPWRYACQRSRIIGGGIS